MEGWLSSACCRAARSVDIARAQAGANRNPLVRASCGGIWNSSPCTGHPGLVNNLDMCSRDCRCHQCASGDAQPQELPSSPASDGPAHQDEAVNGGSFHAWNGPQPQTHEQPGAEGPRFDEQPRPEQQHRHARPPQPFGQLHRHSLHLPATCGIPYGMRQIFLAVTQVMEHIFATC